MNKISVQSLAYLFFLRFCTQNLILKQKFFYNRVYPNFTKSPNGTWYKISNILTEVFDVLFLQSKFFERQTDKGTTIDHLNQKSRVMNLGSSKAEVTKLIMGHRVCVKGVSHWYATQGYVTWDNTTYTIITFFFFFF